MINPRLQTQYLERKARANAFHKSVKEGRYRYSTDTTYEEYLKHLMQNLLKHK